MTMTVAITALLTKALPRHVLLFHHEDGFRVYNRDARSIAADLGYGVRQDGLELVHVLIPEDDLDRVIAYIVKGNCLFGIIEMRDTCPAMREAVHDGGGAPAASDKGAPAGSACPGP